MNVKKTINFTELRKKGFSSLDLKDDEVLIVQSKGEQKCVVNHDYLMSLIKNQGKLFPETLGSLPKEFSAQANSIHSFVDKKLAGVKNEIFNDLKNFTGNFEDPFKKNDDKEDK